MSTQSFSIPVSLAALIVFSIMALPQDPLDIADPLFGVRGTPEFEAGVKQGRAEAEREWAAGRPTSYAAGMGVGPNFDREKGLRFHWIASCVVDNVTLGRERGHNDRIAELIAEQGLPPGTLKPWVSMLLDLRATGKKWLARGRGISLAIDGPPVVGPDGLTALRLFTIRRPTPHQPNGVQAIVVARGGREFPLVRVQVDETRSARAVWGPPGVPFVLLRFDGKYSGWSAIDLLEGRVLNGEFDPEALEQIERDQLNAP